MPFKNIRGYEIPKVSIKEAFKDDFERFKEMYESPIEVIYSQVRTQLIEEEERQMLKAVHDVGVDVDKEELLKALRYDRDQYEKGFEDGKKSIWVDIKERLPEKNGSYLLIVDGFTTPRMGYYVRNVHELAFHGAEYRPGFICWTEFGTVEIKNVVAWLEIPPYREQDDTT